MINPASKRPALDGRWLRRPAVRKVTGVASLLFGASGLALPVATLIGLIHNEPYSRALMIGDLALGASFMSAGTAVLLKPKLGYKLLILVVSVVALVFCSFIMGFR